AMIWRHSARSSVHRACCCCCTDHARYSSRLAYRFPAGYQYPGRPSPSTTVRCHQAGSGNAPSLVFFGNAGRGRGRAGDNALGGAVALDLDFFATAPPGSDPGRTRGPAVQEPAFGPGSYPGALDPRGGRTLTHYKYWQKDALEGKCGNDATVREVI